MPEVPHAGEHHCDAVVVGSRIVQEIADSTAAETGARVQRLTREFRDALGTRKVAA